MCPVASQSRGAYRLSQLSGTNATSSWSVNLSEIYFCKYCQNTYNNQIIFLFTAALAQSVEVVELLVGMNADVHSRDVDGRSPLHGSIVRGARACDVARQLLSVGADPNAPDNFGYTPLHIAALNEFSACVLLLLGIIECCGT